MLILRCLVAFLFSVVLVAQAVPTIVGTIDPAPGLDVQEARTSVHDPATGRIFITGGSTRTRATERVAALDAATGLVLGALELPGVGLQSLAVDSVGGRLFTGGIEKAFLLRTYTSSIPRLSRC